MNYETYHIPANFTDAGRIFGLFEIRNVVEAVILGLPMLFLGVIMPLELTARITVMLALFVPAAGFALIGIRDDCLSRSLMAWRGWRKRRKILTYKGEIDYHAFERDHIRRRRQRI